MNESMKALDFIRTALDFAYEHGLHEIGYDPVEVIRSALSGYQPNEGEPGDYGALIAAAAKLGEFDRAVADELPRVSHVEYDSHEICKHFAAKVRERLTSGYKQQKGGPDLGNTPT